MSSPSEFLTFYRRFATHPRLRSASSNAMSSRGFALSSRLRNDPKVNPDSVHTTNKTDRLDIQNENSGKGRDAKAQGVGGSATSESDTAGGAAKAKKEFPEAPDTVIGMQDERGGKGH
ncbi:hypothetical protein AAFC00_000381 [Neodothiora populina]|uniref:Uncharacterized protein n=1 Tax=Neodothiora populina TaxID=2781224 RepID=A0ABR3PCP7_9PEZI